MMRQLHAVYGEWLLNDCRWDFVVDNVKGARIIFWGEVRHMLNFLQWLKKIITW
ncbi:unnamed protein product, partial [Brassica oleracea]